MKRTTILNKLRFRPEIQQAFDWNFLIKHACNQILSIWEISYQTDQYFQVSWVNHQLNTTIYWESEDDCEIEPYNFKTFIVISNIDEPNNQFVSTKEFLTTPVGACEFNDLIKYTNKNKLSLVKISMKKIWIFHGQHSIIAINRFHS